MRIEDLIEKHKQNTAHRQADNQRPKRFQRISMGIFRGESQNLRRHQLDSECSNESPRPERGQK